VLRAPPAISDTLQPIGCVELSYAVWQPASRQLVIGGEISALARLTPRVSFCPVQRIKVANKAKVAALDFMEDQAHSAALNSLKNSSISAGEQQVMSM
jgi:predicted metal-binding transcription factor (methanogenesis marker protein 9)